MIMKTRADYLALRRDYEPHEARLVIIAESPPISGLYFYDAAGKPSEQLFAAFMRLLGVAPTTKVEGLKEFQRRGWVLVDATYEPIDKLRGQRRDAVIVCDYPLLRDDLMRFNGAPLVLIKANVCKVLEPRLNADGFNVLNRGRAIYFPAHHWPKVFEQQFKIVVNGGYF